MVHHVAVVLVVEYGGSWQFVGDLLERFDLELFNVGNTPQIHKVLVLKRLLATFLLLFRHLRVLYARFELNLFFEINVKMRVNLHVHGCIIHFIDG